MAALQGRVDLNFNLVEKQTKGISGGGGLTSIGQSEGALPGIVANAAYSQHNLFGLNQKLNASVAIGQVMSFSPLHTSSACRDSML